MRAFPAASRACDGAAGEDIALIVGLDAEPGLVAVVATTLLARTGS